MKEAYQPLPHQVALGAVRLAPHEMVLAELLAPDPKRPVEVPKRPPPRPRPEPERDRSRRHPSGGGRPRPETCEEIFDVGLV